MCRLHHAYEMVGAHGTQFSHADHGGCIPCQTIHHPSVFCAWHGSIRLTFFYRQETLTGLGTQTKCQNNNLFSPYSTNLS